MHPIFTAALFMTAKIWKQPNCPSIGEWIKISCTHTHKGILLSYLKKKKKEIFPFVMTWLDLEGITLSEMSEKKKTTTV